MSYRLVALDLDGTLLRSDKTVSSRARRAIETARERGVRVVFASGRRYPSALDLLGSLAGETPLIVHNGALIIEDRSVWFCRPLPRETARAVLLEARVVGAAPVVHGGHQGEGHLWVEAAALANPILRVYLERSGEAVRVVPELLGPPLEEAPIQVMFGGKTQQVGQLRARLEARLPTQVRLEATTYSRKDVAILDVLEPSVGKARALARLQRRWGVASSETLAIGDNGNDREMLLAAGLGLVMANAEPGLLELDLPKLPGNDEDGVAVALEKYVLDGG